MQKDREKLLREAIEMICKMDDTQIKELFERWTKLQQES